MYDAFWVSSFSQKLRHISTFKKIIVFAAKDPSKLYDLTFYGSFANKIYNVMRREGKDSQGFERMQQSFLDSVERVRSVLRDLGESGLSDVSRYTQLSQEGMQNLLDLIYNLAIFKDWQLDQDEGIGRMEDHATSAG